MRQLKSFLEKKKGYCSEGRCNCLLLSAWRDYDVNGCNCEDGFYPMPTSITLSKTEVELNPGDTETITATVLPEEAAKFYPVSWRSSDTTVATVSGGVITYVGAGDATITAKSGNVTATVAVTCVAPVPDYLCFTASEANSTVQLTKEGTPTEVELEISTDGTTWSDYTIGNTITLTNIGDKVYIRNKSETTTGFSTSGTNYYEFVMTGSIAGSGDVNYLLNKNSTTTLSDYCYYYMFQNCESLVTAPELPATELAENCYEDMFYNCTSLTTAPELHATTLADYCYYCMFDGCASLINVPELPATELAEHCYDGMFYDCVSLTTAPSILPATTLAESCYYDMFYGCTSLTTAPELPATTLADYCYYEMFCGCENLINPPALPATTLAEDCYYYMFENCISLDKIPALSATTLAHACYSGMFNGCENIKISETQDEEYVNEYRIPVDGTGVEATDWNSGMFGDTGGTFTGTPLINTTYYTSNTVI